MRTHIMEAHRAPTASRSFREFLQSELAKRCSRNARYSQRAYANYLDIDHATLSQILRGKRTISRATIRRLGAKLGLSSAQIDNYVVAEESSSTSGRDNEPRAQLAHDAVSVLGNWYPAAILELMRLADFRPDARWITRMLGISIEEVQLALHQLISLGFLQMTSSVRWEDLSGGTMYGEEEFTLRAIERLAARSLQLQIESARNDSARPRFHGSSTLAINEDRAPGLTARAAGLFSHMAQAGDERAADTLYRIEVHCYPLTPSNKEDPTDGKPGDSMATGHEES